jgi:hypothetical protein
MTSHHPSNPVFDRCRSCNAPIRWAETEKGRRIPIDAQPVEDGNIVLQDRGKFRPPLAIVHFIPPQDVTVYKSHFATCKQANRWRKK